MSVKNQIYAVFAGLIMLGSIGLAGESLMKGKVFLAFIFIIIGLTLSVFIWIFMKHVMPHR